MTLKVYFVDDQTKLGTACLIENLITNEIKLEIYKNIFINELEHFVDKAVETLKLRFGNDIDVKINWNSLKEGDKDVITSK